MSYASSRTTQIANDGLLLGNIGALIQDGNPALITIPSGTPTTILVQEFPFGVWSGLLTIVYTGDNTTAIERMDLQIQNEDGSQLLRTNILTDITLPDNGLNYYTLTLTEKLNQTTTNRLTFRVIATYTGTAITIAPNAVYTRFVKLV